MDYPGLQLKNRSVVDDQRVSKLFGALRACLHHQERLLPSLPEYSNKDSILRNVTVAKILCEQIGAELNCQSDNYPSDVIASGRTP
jgi:hypothetical protein